MEVTAALSIPETLAEKLRGKFIVLDGPDGAGKSTQHALLQRDLAAAGLDIVSCRDPGGTEIGDRIRSVLLDYDLSTMDITCETLLFMASRAQLLADVIRPALAAGKTVLCDRFVSATCAYQGAAGYDPGRVIALGEQVLAGMWPDVTVVIDVDAETGLDRIGRKPHHAGKNRRANGEQSSLFVDGSPDAMEARPITFHRRVRRMFREVKDYYPRPVVVVDGNVAEGEVYQRILSELAACPF